LQAVRGARVAAPSTSDDSPETKELTGVLVGTANGSKAEMPMGEDSPPDHHRVGLHSVTCTNRRPTMAAAKTWRFRWRAVRWDRQRDNRHDAPAPPRRGVLLL